MSPAPKPIFCLHRFPRGGAAAAAFWHCSLRRVDARHTAARRGAAQRERLRCERAQGYYKHRFGQWPQTHLALALRRAASLLASSNTLGRRRPAEPCDVHGSSLVLHSFAHRKPWEKAASPQSTASSQGSRAPARCPARARAPGPATPSTRALGRRRRAPATAKRNNVPRPPRPAPGDGRARRLLE